jgi:ABC-type transport system involved in resistance to organic solvents, periplasmic component
MRLFHAMSTDRSEEKEQERFWNEFRVGVLAVAALALLVLGVRFLQGTSLFGNTYPLTARFEQAEGVAPGTPVTVRGISVGTVDRVALADWRGRPGAHAHPRRCAAAGGHDGIGRWHRGAR